MWLECDGSHHRRAKRKAGILRRFVQVRLERWRRTPLVTSTTHLEAELFTRSQRRCELCAGTDGVRVYAPAPVTDVVADRCVVVCPACVAAVESSGDLSATGKDGLKDAAWSTVPAVQVLVLRLLPRLDVPWAKELLGQIYVEDDIRAWADAGGSDDEGDPGGVPVDSNGAPLAEGDSVTLIQDLDVKGANFVAKRGTLVKGIRLGDDPAYVEGKVNKSVIMLKTKFLKKA